MKKAKRFKQAMRDLRKYQAIVRLAKQHDRTERNQMNDLNPARKLVDALIERSNGVTVKVVDDEPVDVSSSVVEVIISEDSIAKRVKGDTPAEREANLREATKDVLTKGHLHLPHLDDYMGDAP